MILTVALDPVLENRYYVENLYPKTINKADKVLYKISGKGIICTRILKSLNMDVFSTGFLGGLKGKYIFEELKRQNIYNDFVFIKDETRGNLLLYQKEELISTIAEDGPRITREEIGTFYELFNKLIDRFDLICALGDLPIGVPEEIYFDLIDIAKKRDKRFVLDAKGTELIFGLEAAPFMAIVDREDLEQISRLKLDFENEIIKVGISLLEMGIEVVIIDLDGSGTIVLNHKQGYRLSVPGMENMKVKKDQGYLAAGYVFGIDKGYKFETTMKIGQGFRLAYAMGDDRDLIDMGHIKKIMNEIDISSIYY